MKFVVLEILVAACCWFIAVLGLLYAFSIIFWHKWQLIFSEAFFLCIAGMIRGAIAFGLVLKLDDWLPNKNVLVTSLLIIVIATTILYGSLVPIISAWLMAAKKAKEAAALGTNAQELLSQGHGHG